MTHLIFDSGKCIGCGKCASVCIRFNISIENGKAKELGTDCFDCGHCMAVCPADAIRLERYLDQEDRIIPAPQNVIDEKEMSDFLKSRRSCRWFKKEKIDRATLEKIVDAAYYSPAGMNAQNVEVAILDERLDDFMTLVWDIIKVEKDNFTRIAQFGKYMENPESFKSHPLLWEGKQMICAFSEEPADALIATTRMELMAYSLRLGGFFSLFIMMADRIDHDRVAAFFSEISAEKHMNSVFIIGRPRTRFLRTIPRDEVRTHWY